MPKFAIANGLAIGILPSQFDNATITEHSLCNLGQSVVFVTTYVGGKHKSIRSHTYVMEAIPSPPVTMLPRKVIEEGCFKVVMVGAFTTEQEALIRKRHDCTGLVNGTFHMI
jgi:hypothetical protein